jgi:hypothetical protein
MDLRSLVDSTAYRGMIVLSDIHAELSPLVKAIEYAQENDLFILFLGDLVDGSVYPFEVVELAKDLLDRNHAAAVIGNHEEKFYRWTIGNPVKLGKSQLATLEDVGETRMDDFARNIQATVTHPRAAHYFHYGNTIFAHGGVHADLWERPDDLRSSHKHTSLYGEVDGTKDERGFPVRTYAWVTAIPNGCRAVVGHDRDAMGKSNVEQKVVVNDQGGEVFFTDTSCGKPSTSSEGFLTGTMFVFVDDELEFVKFLPFYR